MATEVKLPRLGQGMESGTIVKWLKSEGEPVSKGDPLYELDTDKVTQEVEAETSGVLLKIAIESGEVEVGKTIGVIGEQGEEVALEQPSSDGGAPQSAERPAEAPARQDDRQEGRAAAAKDAAAQTQGPQPGAPQTELEPVAAAQTNGRLKASPLARRIARERGIDLAQVRGTGPEGRIVADDVEQAQAAPTAGPAPALAPSGEPETIELTSTRRTIARRLTEAWQAPVFQLSVSADMTRVQELRERLVARLAEGEPKPTVNDVLTKLAGVALVRHRAVNAHYTGENIVRFPYAHVGIAVAAPNGLIVPVIRDADRRSISELAAARADLVGRAREGKLQRSDLEDGTFTISNLGMYGMEQFVAVLNPPQAAILAVGSIEEKPVARGGEIVVRPLMQLTLTCDHRAIDGADGAEFLRTLRELLEDPALAL
jgi:pyruvate dehydrogenase E2 component (dihydrolipoamide acetyltransferase)